MKHFIYVCAFFLSLWVKVSPLVAVSNEPQFVILGVNITTEKTSDAKDRTTYLESWIVEASLDTDTTYEYLFKKKREKATNNQEKWIGLQIFCMRRNGKVHHTQDHTEESQVNDFFSNLKNAQKTFAAWNDEQDVDYTFERDEIRIFLQQAYDFLQEAYDHDKILATSHARFKFLTAFDLVEHKKTKAVVVKKDAGLNLVRMEERGIVPPQRPVKTVKVPTDGTNKQFTGYVLIGCVVGYGVSYILYPFPFSSKKKEKKIVFTEEEEDFTGSSPVIIPGKVSA